MLKFVQQAQSKLNNAVANSSALLQHLGIGGNIFGNPYVATDDGVVTDGDAAEDGTVAVDDDIVIKNGVAINALDGVALLVEREALGSEGDSLIELHMVAEDAGGTDDNAGAVVDGEVTADGGGRVYVDARLAMGQLGDDAGDEGHTQEVELVCYAVARDGAYGGVAADDLSIAGGSGVALVGGCHIGGEEASQVGQSADKLIGDALGFVQGALALVAKAEPCLDLSYEFMVEVLQIDSRVVGDGVVADAGVPEVAGKENSTAQGDDLAQLRE